MAANQNVLSALVGLISSLVTCVQLNVAMSTVHLNYVKQRFDILRILSTFIAFDDVIKLTNRNSN